MFRHSKPVVLAILLASAATGAHADRYAQKNDAMAISHARISLTQAVDIAERHAHGKATHAELEREKHGLVYEVEVVGKDKVFDVRIDAVKGTVISAKADKPDGADEDDHEMTSESDDDHEGKGHEAHDDGEHED